jgi:hypothetical protein
VTWAQIVSAYPGATLADSAPGVGGMRFTSGLASAGNHFDTNIDAFTIGVNGTDTTYDFEPTAPVPEASTWVMAALASALIIGQVVRAYRFSKAQPKAEL